LDEPGDEWKSVDPVNGLVLAQTLILYIYVLWNIFIDMTFSPYNLFWLAVALLFYVSILSYFIRHWRGQRLDLHHNGNISSTHDVVRELETVLELRRARFHLHLIPTVGSPVYYIDGDRKQEMRIHVDRKRVGVQLAKGVLIHKEQVEDVLRGMLG
jgi:hypothetical protein